jgi:hypothetical protein
MEFNNSLEPFVENSQLFNSRRVTFDPYTKDCNSIKTWQNNSAWQNNSQAWQNNSQAWQNNSQACVKPLSCEKTPVCAKPPACNKNQNCNKDWWNQLPDLHRNIHEKYSGAAIWWTCIIAIVVIWILGFILHQLYGWSNSNTFLGYFVPVNESVWEHAKLFWLSFILVGIVLWFIIGKYTKNFIFALGVSLTVMIILMIAIFYTYTGAFGIENAFIDILIYFVVAVIGVWIAYKIIAADPFMNFTLVIGWALIIAWSAMLIAFTYNPPNIPLFTSAV